MKIGFLGPIFPYRGGIAKFSTLLAGEFQAQHSIKFYSFKHQYPKLFFPGKNQISESTDPGFDVTYDLTPYNPLTWNSTKKNINKWNPDVLIINYWIPFFAPAFGYISKRLNKKIKIYYIIHNIDFHEKWLFAKSLTKYAMRRADKLITLSNSVNTDLKKLFPNKKTIKGFHPVYNCYNNDNYFSDSAKAKLQLKGKKVILFFGFIKPYKGLELLIRSMPFVLSEITNSHLLIVGEVYKNSNKYLQLIENYSLKENVTFINRYVKDDEVELFFKAADLLVLPYLQATQSGVVQIAYDMNLGTVATPVGSLPDIVITSKTGIIAREVSVPALKNAIIEYFNLDPQTLRNNIVKERKKYSWNTLADLVLA
ncbi:MAG: glycosyltransferase [Candidatus Cloacimonetes bacterium]|nr:glycosyltransferase [Candidatus Cloacimonadota bacterium]